MDKRWQGIACYAKTKQQNGYILPAVLAIMMVLTYSMMGFEDSVQLDYVKNYGEVRDITTTIAKNQLLKKLDQLNALDDDSLFANKLSTVGGVDSEEFLMSGSSGSCYGTNTSMEEYCVFITTTRLNNFDGLNYDMKSKLPIADFLGRIVKVEVLVKHKGTNITHNESAIIRRGYLTLSIPWNDNSLTAGALDHDEIATKKKALIPLWWNGHAIKETPPKIIVGCKGITGMAFEGQCIVVYSDLNGNIAYKFSGKILVGQKWVTELPVGVQNAMVHIQGYIPCRASLDGGCGLKWGIFDWYTYRRAGVSAGEQICYEMWGSTEAPQSGNAAISKCR